MIEYKPDYYINMLKEEFNLLAIKAEFEAEGSTIEELAELSNMCTSSEIPLTLKIGGPSAQRDMHEAWQIGSSNILVPMVESHDAIKTAASYYTKCSSLYQNSICNPSLLINIETDACMQQLKRIYDVVVQPSCPVSGLVIGRSDLSSSMSIKNAEDDAITSCIYQILELFKNTEVKVTVGGSITNNSYECLKSAASRGLFAFETRKCTMSTEALHTRKNFQSAVKNALLFEMSWLLYKKENQERERNMDELRIKAIERRLSL